MPDINMQVFKEVRRNQLVTEIDIQTQVALDDYQVQLSDIANPTQSQDNVVIDRFGEFLSHWNESLDFDTWIKMSMEIAGKRILMFHGNSNVGSGSSGDDVFIGFDDFETGEVSKWTIDSGVTFEASTSVVKTGTYSGRHKSTGDGQVAWLPLQQYKGDFIVEADWYCNYVGAKQNRVTIYEDSTLLANVIVKVTNTDILLNNVDVGEFSSSAWYTMKLVIKDLSTDTATLYWNESELGTQNNYDNMTNGATKLGILQYFAAGTYQYIDNIKVRKYTVVEPTYLIGTSKNISTALKSLGRAG